MPHATTEAPFPSRPFPAVAPGRVINERQEGEAYEAEVEAARSSYILFKMTWHPNWKALVDGKPVKTIMLSPGFLGAPVTPGRHRIWLQYEPANWKVPMALAGLLAVLLLGAAERFGYLPGARAASELTSELAPIPVHSAEHAAKPLVRRKSSKRGLRGTPRSSG